MKLRQATRLATAAMAALILVLTATAGSSAALNDVTLRDAKTHFSISAPAGFRLSVNKGVYVLRKGGESIGFSRTATSASAGEYGAALLAQLGGRLLTGGGGASRYSAVVADGARRESFLIVRSGSVLTVTTGSATGRVVSVASLARVGGSAAGGLVLRPSAATSAPSVPLVPYRLPDGSASALVPAGSDWTILGGNGVIQGSSPNKGSFLFGFSISILTPQNAPANPPPSMLIYPYLNAATALGTILHRLSPSVSDFSIVRVLRDAALPSFTSSGMLLFDFLNDGKPWVGVATIGTDSPANYGNFSWTMYYSGISVPADSDGSVGQALLRAWHSWDPSAAIAARTQASLDLTNETNSIWNGVSQFSSSTRDRQARDVGCLLLGYYDVEDNSRKFNLPSAPCGLAYVPANG